MSNTYQQILQGVSFCWGEFKFEMFQLKCIYRIVYIRNTIILIFAVGTAGSRPCPDDSDDLCPEAGIVCSHFCSCPI